MPSVEPARRTTCVSILVVEDEADIRETIAALLEEDGYHVVTAANGLEGLERLRTIPRPCLVLLDFMMPVMNGQEFLALKHANDAIAAIPVVVVSAYEERARSLEASGFVKKPIDLESLLSFVRRFCGHRGARSAELSA